MVTSLRTSTGTGLADTGCPATGFLGKAGRAHCLLVASRASLGSWSGTSAAELPIAPLQIGLG